MNVLVLGGTRFVGRHLVEAALAAGHRVTLFNRGSTAPGLFHGVEELRGERSGDHAALAGRNWDVVFDVSGYRPSELRAAMARLRGRVGLYAFVSTVSVYRHFESGGDEDAPTWAPAPDDAPSEPETYGPLKRACELALEKEWGGRWLVARSGLIAGPHDPTDRFTYWPARMARAGQVLAPGAPEHPVQFVDARDLAAWLVTAAWAGTQGVYNVLGPARPFSGLLVECAAIAGTLPEFVWVDDAFLTFHGLKPYQDLPLWVPGSVSPFLTGRAEAAGLQCRPGAETAADVLRWHRERGEPALRAGLDAAQEARLLEEAVGGA